MDAGKSRGSEGCSGGANISLVAVGIDHYPHAHLPTLSCAVNDAETVCALFLSNRRKVNVRLLTNSEATVQNIRDAVIEAACSAGSDGTFVLMFSGHGAPLNRGGIWQGACLTHDFRSLSELYQDPEGGGAFTLHNVKQWLNEAPLEQGPGNIICLIDACGSGLSITHDSAADRNLQFEGKRAVARSMAVRDVSPDDLGLSLGTPVPLDVDQGAVTWPAGSRFAAVVAARGDGLAYEVPELGHGLFSLALTEWLKHRLLATDGQLDNFGASLVSYALSRLQSFNSTIVPPAVPQNPDSMMAGTIQIDNSGCVIDGRRFHNLVSLSSRLPAPDRLIDAQVFDANVGEVITKVTGPAKYPGDANIVIDAPRFSGTRRLLASVVDKLRRSGQLGERPVLYFGMGRIRRIMPLIGSLHTAFEANPEWPTVVTAYPPLIGEEGLELAEELVEQLRWRQAVVVVPYHRSATDKLTEYFLQRCARVPEIRLVLVLYGGERVPEWACLAHYKIVKLETLSPRQLEMSASQLEIGTADLIEPFRNETVLRWLERLHGQVSGVVQWHAQYNRFILPYNESDNDLRALLNILQDLLPLVGSESEQSLTLLRAMSVTGLPCSQRLVGHLWNTLRQTSLVGEPQTLASTLEYLTGLQLITESAPSEDKHYFVHSVVRRAVAELEAHSPAPDPNVWHRCAAMAYRKLLDDAQHATIWPRPILVHEAIQHLLDARMPREACRVMLDNWQDLLDGGYQEVLLRWSQRLRREIPTASTDVAEIGASLRLLTPLLVRLQGLYRHRQQWDRTLQLDEEIQRRVADYQTRNGHDDSLTSWFWKSKENVANYRFIRKDFVQAARQYEQCYQWAGRACNRELECSSAIRLAHCNLHLGHLDKAEHQLQEVEQLIGQLEESDPPSAWKYRQHVRSVRIELHRLMEDGDEVFRLACEAWQDALAATSETGIYWRFGLAVASVHMAWGALFRGEFLRAWRHAGRARRFLCDRRIAEHRWFAETERISALAIALALRDPDRHPQYQPWHKEPCDRSEATRALLGQYAERQRKSLEALIDVCRVHSPWRAAELTSALGQLIAHHEQNREEAVQCLKEAQRLAERHAHHVLRSYVLEALALLHQGKEAARYFHDAYQCAEQAGPGRFNQRRKENWRTSTAIARNSAATDWQI